MSNGPVDSNFPEPINPLPQKPFIDGIEVTQAIQYYKPGLHLTDSKDYKDNSILLVANKPAYVRVYVHDLSGSGRSVTGELVVERNEKFPPIWKRIETLKPVNSSVVPSFENFDYATERGNLAATLNFIIPSKSFSYNIRLRTSIWQEEGGSKDNPDDKNTTFLAVMLRQTLRLRGVMINYSGPESDPTSATTPPPNIDLAAPTTTDLQNTAAWTLTTNPVQSRGIFSSAGTMQWSTPLTGMATGPGGCSLEWIDLIAAVAEVKANDGNRPDVIYYGLLPIGTPIQNVGGCALNGVSISVNGQQIVMAHEVGHAAGLQHAPCRVPGDPKYPAYEPYDPLDTPTGSLGEYGLNINNGDIHLPRQKDYMGYCSQDWISLYHHSRLTTDNETFNPEQLSLSVSEIPVLVDPYLWPWEYIPDPPWWQTNLADIRVNLRK